MSDAKPFLSKRWPWLLAGAVVVLGFLSTVFEIRLTDPRPKGGAEMIEQLAERDDFNLLFILVDTLRADRLGAYGYERDTSPAVDAVASRGVRFAHHLAQSSWTKCSMASMWTSLNPARTGVTRFEDVLPDEARMPAEILQDAGFTTAGLFRNGWVEGYFGFDQGFEVYTRPVGRPIPPSVKLENPTVKEVGTDLDIVDTSMEFLRVHGKNRWFLYVHLMDLHEYLYDESSALFGTRYSDVYDNSILRTNNVLADFFERLKRSGHWENTMIVIASDHGEAFGERGNEGHARKVYRESTEVPFLISFPFKLEQGIVLEQRTRNVDIWPTLLDLLGLPAREGTDGRSFRPEILAAAAGRPLPEQPEAAYAHLDQTWGLRSRDPMPTVAVAERDYRYVVYQDHGGRQREQLFDRGRDPAELEDLLAEEPEVAERLRALGKVYLEGEPPWTEEPAELEIDEMQLNQLRALGYSLP